MREVLKDAYSAQQQREGELLKCNLPSLLLIVQTFVLLQINSARGNTDCIGTRHGKQDSLFSGRPGEPRSSSPDKHF